MSPFPKALATAQREAVTNDLREIRVSLNATRASLKGAEPHLLGLDRVGYSLVITHLNDAEKCVAASIEAITDEAVHA